jgi:hypothetical protein
VKPGTLEALRAALRRPDFSHVSYRSWCGQDLLFLYRRAPESPSHCELIEGGCRDTPEARRVIAEEGRRVQAGGQQGHPTLLGR